MITITVDYETNQIRIDDDAGQRGGVVFKKQELFAGMRGYKNVLAEVLNAIDPRGVQLVLADGDERIEAEW